jgi:hypothetical protein
MEAQCENVTHRLHRSLQCFCQGKACCTCQLRRSIGRVVTGCWRHLIPYTHTTTCHTQHTNTHIHTHTYAMLCYARTLCAMHCRHGFYAPTCMANAGLRLCVGSSASVWRRARLGGLLCSLLIAVQSMGGAVSSRWTVEFFSRWVSVWHVKIYAGMDRWIRMDEGWMLMDGWALCVCSTAGKKSRVGLGAGGACVVALRTLLLCLVAVDYHWQPALAMVGCCQLVPVRRHGTPG